MKMPSQQLLSWAIGAVAPGASVTEVIGLRDGQSPWLLRASRDGAGVEVVVREGDPAWLRTEAAAMEFAADHGIPAPRLIAADFGAESPAIILTKMDGTSVIPMRPGKRMRELGAIAARLHCIELAVTDALPRRERPIPGVDFADLRRSQAELDPLLSTAEERVAGLMPYEPWGFVHGDLWQGNSMWIGEALKGVIDWDCAGVGPAGVDLGSLRCDAALCFGLDAADEVTAGWEAAAGRPAMNVAHWDVVAALSTPPDMGWFVSAISAQGRPDLTQPLLVERRDAFLADALKRLDS